MIISLNCPFLTASSLFLWELSSNTFRTQGNQSSNSSTFPPEKQSSSPPPLPPLTTLTSHQRNQIGLYMDSLLQWNQKMNLTAVKDENEVMERHLEDSLAIVEPICSSYISCCRSSFQNLSVVDVGSGAGLPGIILAIACRGDAIGVHEQALCLLVACGWLRRIAKCASYAGRAEDRIWDFREGFDVAFAGAVVEMRVLAEYCLPLVHGGLFLAAKGHGPQEEIIRAERAIHVMGASILQTCLANMDKEQPFYAEKMVPLPEIILVFRVLQARAPL